MSATFPGEHPVTRRARLAVTEVNRLEHALFIAQAKLDAAKREMVACFHAMEKANVPAELWENHWRPLVDLPVRGEAVAS